MSGYGFTNAGTTYDDEDRLTGYQRTNGALSQSWNLTSVGDWNSVTTNGTAQSRTHGPTHELLTAGGQTVNTDVKGNITLLPTALSSLASTALGMSWDFDNKLKSVDVGNNSSTDVEYKYDALGRRVARVGSSGSFVYVQSDQQTIADYGVGDAPSSPLYRYVYASYIDEPVVRKGAGTGGTIHYYHRNQQYSITAVTTSAGAIAERYAYSAYGEPTICDSSGSVLASSAINNRYTYTGREWDATVGLHHFRARWMTPKTGRFLGRDPIGYWDGMNLTSCYFALSDVDPNGTQILGSPALSPRLTPILPRPRLYVPPPEPVPFIPIPPVPPIGPFTPSSGPGQGQPPIKDPRPIPEPLPGPSQPGNGIRPPGDCSQDEHDRLYRMVVWKCKDGKLAKCTQGWFWTCDDFKEMQNNFTECADARRKLDQRCYRGGDWNHQVQEAQMRNAAQWCAYYFRRDCIKPDPCYKMLAGNPSGPSVN